MRRQRVSTDDASGHGGGDNLLFAGRAARIDVGHTGFRRCRPPGANLSCESESRLAMSAWIGARELALVRGEAVMDDILIRGGQVIDGTGAPARVADVAIRAGRIVAIEADRADSAGSFVDAHGSVVAPGFIDIHTHSDFPLPLNPKAEAKIRQGVTTEVVGNCGFSVAPALPGKVESLREYLSGSAPWLAFADNH